MNAIAVTMTESELQEAVFDLARLFKWASYHTYDSRRSSPGFPDLVLARDRVMFVELKSSNGRLSPAQRLWKVRLEIAGAEHHIWRPDDWTDGTIERTLK